VNVRCLPRIVLITGTDTGVGKTITTAALAAVLARTGSVAVYKPVQTGVRLGAAGDVEVVRRLTGIEACSEGTRLPEPMAPRAAAERAGVWLPPLRDHVQRMGRLAAAHEHVLVEGAGGLLVQLDHAGHTLADLAAALPESGMIVVCRSTLGTLNHTALTVEALEHRGITVAGITIGAWPRSPSAIEIGNRDHFAMAGIPLLGSLPENAGTRSPESFRQLAGEVFDEAASEDCW